MTDDGVPGAGRDDYVRIGRPAEEFSPRTPIRETPPRPEPSLQPIPLEAMGALPNPWELWLWVVGIALAVVWFFASLAPSALAGHGAALDVAAWIAELTVHVWPVALGAAAVLAGMDRLHRQRALLRRSHGDTER
jgi:hypothetical protein